MNHTNEYLKVTGIQSVFTQVILTWGWVIKQGKATSFSSQALHCSSWGTQMWGTHTTKTV